MNKLLYLTLPMFFLGLQSCNNDDIIKDYAPYILHINVVDSEGNDLLNPAVEGNVTGEKIEMYYDGEFYPMHMMNTQEAQSRYYLPIFNGLVLNYPSNSIRMGYLSWGEFDYTATATYNFSLHFADRNCEPYEFELKIEYKNDKAKAKLKANGKEVKTEYEYTVVLP